MRRQLDFAFLLLIAVLVSFCSMGYELLIVRFLSTISSDSVMSQSLTIGLFLLSLGIGAYVYTLFKARSLWATLATIELVISIIAAMALPALALMSLFVKQPVKFIFTAQLVTVMIGTLSGLELPALIDLATPFSKRAFGWVLAANYVGSLIASIVLPMHLIPAAGLNVSSWILALLTALAATLMLARTGTFRLHPRLILLVIAVLLPPYLVKHKAPFDQFYLKSYYYLPPSNLSIEEIKTTITSQRFLPNVLRFSTPYQDIDIASDNLEMFGAERTHGFHLFIDERNQFGSATEQIYHDTMVHGAINMAKWIPKKVLIIGGGDGLIAHELLKYNEIESIRQIELDPQMIQLALKFKPLRALNKGSFLDPRVKVVYGDGFSMLRTMREQFDAIFVDLPHPVTVDLARLYSVEFYKFIHARLNPKGFLIFDFPFDGLVKTDTGSQTNVHAVEAVVAAVRQAGFPSYRAIGSWESFLLATPEKRELEFDYEKLAPLVTTQSAFNIVPYELPPQPEHVQPNSVFKPVVLKIRLDGAS